MTQANVSSRRALLAAAAALAVAGAAPAAHAQAYPAKPIRIVTGFPAGTATDGMARALAEVMRVKLGQPVVVENRPGANGSIGATEVARAAPDGYTLLATNSSSITANPQIYRKISYLPERDLTPITMGVSAPFILVVNPAAERTAGVNTVADLVALAKKTPLTYSSGGPGNLAHLGFEMFSNRAGIKATHVPYKGGVPAQIGLMGKEVDLMFDTPNTIPNLKAGKLKALAVTGAKRWPDLPDVPTIAESGYPGFDLTFWLGVFAPAKTPPEIVQKLYDAMLAARDDATAARLLHNQGTIEMMPPQEFAARIKAETAMWGEIIKRENIQLD